MDFTLTEEQVPIRNTCREFAEQEIKPRAQEMDRTGHFRTPSFAVWANWDCWACLSRSDMAVPGLISSPIASRLKKYRVVMSQ
jgi:alkylation response protein AidB-like acyl-CoA dehydrogenase